MLASVYVKHAIYNDTNKHAFWRTPWSQSSSFSREIILKISLKNYKKRNTLCHDLVNSMNLWTVLECPVLLLRYTKNRRVAHIIVCDRWNINKNIIIRHLFIVYQIMTLTEYGGVILGGLRNEIINISTTNDCACG